MPLALAAATLSGPTAAISSAVGAGSSNACTYAPVALQAALAGLLGWAMGAYSSQCLPTWVLALSLVLLCSTIVGFGMSWCVGAASCSLPCS